MSVLGPANSTGAAARAVVARASVRVGQPLAGAARSRDASRTGSVMSRAPAASKTAPAISRPVAIHGSAGNEAATLTRTFTGAEPFAFMATTVQRPPVTGHDSVWVPGPVVFTVQ